mmetsp:Transcript_15799/g.23803  ORF Transcript_15799/g.23803 Transcript_15799/m.23803 type:complete len:714 (+) Transcript_15799:65-2206(+)
MADSKETNVELIDEHILGMESDDEEIDELMRGIEQGEKRLGSSWKHLIPIFIVIVGLMFTAGFILGTSSENTSSEVSKNAFVGNNAVFSSGNRVQLENEIKSLKDELKKEEKISGTMQGALKDLERKWISMTTKIAQIDELERKESQLESLGTQKNLKSVFQRDYEQLEKEFHKVEMKERETLSHLTEEVTEVKKKLEEVSGSAGAVKPNLGMADPVSHPTNIDKVNLEDLRSAVIAYRKKLEKYWEGTQVLRDTLHLKPGDSSYDQGVKRIAEKMARAIVWGDKFIIGAMGSSVTAAHDNCNYDSYERQMERELQPIFSKANVEFTVRNAGEGGGCGDSYRNQIWCLRNIIGDDVDIAHYSWTYFENEDKETYHEMFIRWVLMMERSPVPQFINVGETRSCKSALDHSGKLFDLYGKYGVNINCLQSGILKIGYPGKKWGAIGDGMHTTTRYGELSNVTKSRRDSLGVTFRNWHPGPLGFQVVSDAFGYHYTDALLEAINMIEDERSGHSDIESLARRWPEKPSVLSKEDLPPPIYCEERICNVDEPPGCTNWEVPTYGRGQVKILDPKDSMNPFKDLAKEGDKGWKKWQGDRRQLVPKAELKQPECLHLDVCAGVEITKDSGLITFRLPRMDVGRIMVCSPEGKQAGYPLRKSVEYNLEGSIIPNPQQVYGKCALVQSEWGGTVADSKGHIHLGVRVIDDQIIRISHVIAM